jgi:hypothetical protein
MRTFYTNALAEEAFQLLQARMSSDSGAQALLKRLSELQRDQHSLSAYREEAREAFGRDGEREIDNNAIVSIDDGCSDEHIAGAYVQGWFWVSADALPEKEQMAAAAAVRPVTQILYYSKEKASDTFDIHGMFAPDALGYSPPKVVLGGLTRNDNEEAKWYPYDGAQWTVGNREESYALPLVWDGKVVPQSILRAAEILQRVWNITGPIHWGPELPHLTATWNLGSTKKISSDSLGTPPEGLTLEQLSAWYIGTFCVQTLGGQLIVTSEASHVSSR